MIRRALACLLVVVSLVTLAPTRTDAAAGRFTHHVLPASPSGAYPSRGYWLYVPAKLAPAASRPLITFLHGCTQTAVEAARGVRWNALADRIGAAVVYPEQHIPTSPEADGSPAGCWNPGQAAAYPRGEGELESVARITRTVAAKYGTDKRRSFLMGVSGGALMSNVLAATYPDLYAAFASVAGCSYLCSDPTGDLAYRRMDARERVMPVFVVTGSLDYLANPLMGELTVMQWLGTNDLADDGTHNQSVSLRPTTVHERDFDELGEADPTKGDACLHDPPRNPCVLGALGVSPYPTTVRTWTDATGRPVVEAWLVHGLSHNYSGGSFAGTFTDPYGPDITKAAWRFFSAHARS